VVVDQHDSKRIELTTLPLLQDVRHRRSEV
jgi:hypothetical protein